MGGVKSLIPDWRYPVRGATFPMPRTSSFKTDTMPPTSNRAAFTARLAQDRPADVETAEKIILWAKSRDLALRWTSATETDSMMGSLRLGVQEHKLLTLQTNGLVWVLVTQLAARLPIRDEDAKAKLLADFRERLMTLPRAGQSASGKGAKIAFRLEDLRAAGGLDGFYKTLEWMMAQLKTSFDTMRVAGHRRERRPAAV